MAERELARAAASVNREADRGVDGTTLLAREDAFEGAMRIKGDGMVLGGFEGEIECGGELQIGRDADVNANIRSVNLTIAGRVQGNVVVTGRLRITATGRLEGDAKVGALVVQEGGVHLGMIKVHPEGIPAEDQRFTPLIQRPPGRPQLSAPAQLAPQPAQSLPEHAGADANGNGDGGKPVDRVKKLWGEFF